jgi:hypothetical protein
MNTILAKIRESDKQNIQPQIENLLKGNRLLPDIYMYINEYIYVYMYISNVLLDQISSSEASHWWNKQVYCHICTSQPLVPPWPTWTQPTHSCAVFKVRVNMVCFRKVSASKSHKHFSFSHTYHMPRQSHPSPFDHPLAQAPGWRATPCWLSATVYSKYSQFPVTPRGRLLSPQAEAVPCRGTRKPLSVGIVCSSET